MKSSSHSEAFYLVQQALLVNEINRFCLRGRSRKRDLSATGRGSVGLNEVLKQRRPVCVSLTTAGNRIYVWTDLTNFGTNISDCSEG